MRVLLVHPRFPTTYWSYEYALPFAGKRSSLPPLGLLTVAALLPPSWSLRLVDLGIESLEPADVAWADVVLVSGMLVQTDSMLEILETARAAGRRVIAGGPAPTSIPERFAAADHVFRGELEGAIGLLVSAIEHPGREPHVLEGPSERPELTGSPVPRYDLLDVRRYGSMSLQYSRGCPFTCEFCDVIELFGRRPRVKTPAQVLAELGAIHRTGYRGSVFFVDDNFIGNKRAVRELLPHVAAWQAEHGRPFELYTEASLNLASDRDLVRAMVDAGFSTVFTGIETPSADALRDAGKAQNLRLDPRRAVNELTEAGLEVMSGFIVGFDSDDESIFEEQRAFLASTPIPLAMVGILTALPGTALWRRLRREGRLLGEATGDQFGRPNFATAMDPETLLRGYAGLLEALYSPRAYVQRCIEHIERAPRSGRARRVLRASDLLALGRAVVRLGLLGRRRRWFWRLVLHSLRRAPHTFSWAVTHAILGEHMIRYTHEDVLPRLRRTLAALRAERTPAGKAGPTRLEPAC